MAERLKLLFHALVIHHDLQDPRSWEQIRQQINNARTLPRLQLIALMGIAHTLKPGNTTASQIRIPNGNTIASRVNELV